MKKQSANRKYNFPDADLYLLCVEKLKQAHSEKALFKQYGYEIQRMKTFKDKVDRFGQLPNDDELVGDQMLTTEKKYTAAENLKTAIRSVMTRVAMKYSNRSGRYRKFGTAKMGDMTDAQLIFCGRRVVRVSRQQIDFLADVGLNEKVLKRVTDACSAFENAVNIQQDKVSERDISVERRTDLGNQIYDELIMLCNIGKDIWAESNRAKYDNYVLYESNNDQKIARKEKEKKEK